MKVGDRVKTTQEWNEQYYKQGITGTILKIPLRGPNPQYRERNYYVDLDEQIGEWKRLWFDPNHLEYEE